MVDVAEELGVDAIGLNHLMFSTPEEVAETVADHRRADAVGHRDVRHAGSRARRRAGPHAGRRAAEKCRERNILFDFRPKVHTPLMDSYYTPGTKLDGRCLYPFLHARVSFSGKVYFCPFIRVEVGDLTQSSLEEVWNGERYVADAQAAARARDLPGLPPLLQGRAVAGAGGRHGRIFRSGARFR